MSFSKVMMISVASVLIPTWVCAQTPYPGVLQPIGALHCSASLDADAGRERSTELDCDFRRAGELAGSVSFSGRLIGSGLYLVDPGAVRLVWNVLAPTPEVRTEAIAGSYDLTARPDYQLKGARDDILYGGLGDTFALVLLAPARLDGINAETQLTLRMERDN